MPTWPGFPARTLSFAADPQNVVRLFGSLNELPYQPTGSGGAGRSPEA
jgi:hypothetical protein